METVSTGYPQGSIMLLPTKVVSDRFVQQLPGRDPIQGMLLSTQELTQEIRDTVMKGVSPSSTLIQGDISQHKKCRVLQQTKTNTERLISQNILLGQQIGSTDKDSHYSPIYLPLLVKG